MKEKPIYEIKPPEDHPEMGVGALNKEFIEREFLSRENIRAMARVAASEVLRVIGLEKDASPENKTTIIVRALDSKQIFNNEQGAKALKKAGYKIVPSLDENMDVVEMEIAYKRKDGPRIKTVLLRQDIEDFLSKIRGAIYEELKNELSENILDSATVYLVEKALKRSGRVESLYGGGILKNPFKFEDKRDRRDRLAALRKLYALKERSPYILYQTDVIDPKQELLEIQKPADVKTLQEMIDAGGAPPFPRMLKYVSDAMRGAIFLIQHGLALSDNTLDNIAVDKSRDIGALFDFDGLRDARQNTPNYITHLGYMPPEAQRLPEAPTTEAEMVYEFGKCIKFLSRHYGGPWASSYSPFFDLSLRMTENDPALRPSLSETVNAIVIALTKLK